MAETQSKSSRDLDRLLSQLVDGRADADDIDALERLLRDDPQARRHYVRYLDLHSELLHHAEMYDSAVVVEVPPAANPLRWFHMSTLIAIAATLLIAVGFGIGSRPWSSTIPEVAEEGSGPTDDGVAILVHAVDVEWAMNGPPSPGSILSPGHLNMERGLVQIEFYGGARLVAEGPFDLEIVSVNQAICRNGKLRAFVPLHARGFSVLAPQFEVVDLGTEFGMEVANDGQSQVQVFSGVVELYPPDGKRVAEHRRPLLSGNGLAWSSSGTQSDIEPDPRSFPSFADVRARTDSESRRRYDLWQAYSKSLKDDSRIVVHYDFESYDSSQLLDSGKLHVHGSIVGSDWSTGRWPLKHALEFKRPGDRVRIDVPGEFDTMTIAAWIRVDALSHRRQSLLLTDNYKVGHLHWQIGRSGDLRIGTRTPALDHTSGVGYGSPRLFTPKQVGLWNHVCSVYDRPSRRVRHYFNGHEVASVPIEFDQSIQIGAAEIGNWGEPLQDRDRAIRNFIGRMDELSIWNTALDSTEINRIYHETRP